MKQKTPVWKVILSYMVVQFAVGIYSFSGVAGKLASGHPFLSVPFVAYYALEIICLGIYAIAWQQVIKRMDLSVAYVNRSVALLWSLLWSVLLFKEKIMIQNLIGAAIIISGIILVNTAAEEAKSE